MRIRAFLFAWLLVCPLAAQLRITTGSGAGERQPVVNAQGTLVAYGAFVTGVREVFTVPVDGGAAVRRTTGANVIFAFGTFDMWPSLSVSDDGTRIAYWNAGGVHVIDTVATTDLVVNTANINTFPQIEPGGGFVVYQSPSNGVHEVFRVPATGGAAVPLTTGSGGGHRFPTSNGQLVLFQDVVSGNQELFVFDLVTSNRRQITQNSGGGNRYGRFAGPNLVVYEAVGASNKEVWVVDPAVGFPSMRRVTPTSSGGDRLAVGSADQQIAFQSVVTNQELFLVNADGTGETRLTPSGAGAGVRRPSIDGHGHVIVYQSLDAGNFEVFQVRMCPNVTITPFGQNGPPSVGTLQSFQGWYRCELVMGTRTSLPASTMGAWFAGGVQYLPGLPLPGAPGNFIYVGAALVLPVTFSGGEARVQVYVPPIVYGTAYYQIALMDPAANPLGIVTTEGVQLTFF